MPAGMESSRADEERGQRQFDGVGVAVEHQRGDALAHAQRLAEIAVQHAFPIVDVLHVQRQIEAILMTQGGHVSGARAVAQHLLDGVAGHQMNQEENERDHQPQHGQGVEQTDGERTQDTLHASAASPVSSFIEGSSCTRILLMRLPSISITVSLRPS